MGEELLCQTHHLTPDQVPIPISLRTAVKLPAGIMQINQDIKDVVCVPHPKREVWHRESPPVSWAPIVVYLRNQDRFLQACHLLGIEQWPYGQDLTGVKPNAPTVGTVFDNITFSPLRCSQDLNGCRAEEILNRPPAALAALRPDDLAVLNRILGALPRD